MMKTSTISPQTFFKRPAISRLFKALSLFLITATLLPVSCKKDKKTSPGVSLMVSTFAGTGSISQAANNGPGTDATFNQPIGIAVDAQGNVYVADELNNRIRKISPEGGVSTLAGGGFEPSANCTGADAKFINPYGVAVDQAGNVYVADTGNNRIRKITQLNGQVMVSTLAGDGTGDFNDKPIGSQEAARFKFPRGIAVDQAGNVYVADDGNHRIRKISTITISGAKTVIVNTLAGDGTTAIFKRPTGVAVDAGGVVYVADTGNHRIRKITTAAGTATVSTLAGSDEDLGGDGGFAEGTGTAAKFYYPYGVAISKDGHLYVADTRNHRIRKITLEGGVVNTLAGSGYINPENGLDGGFLDGKASAARFNYPGGVAAGADGNVYVADTYNHRIRKIE